ncbi:hypothetical protein P280DRAFT_470885 [Massarina eburnea CBS 473.64]|uniref:25S rRNA (uridine-N(3))-methyltransferase BMT5-like domain-containing protein n=1 Tax=Massarina eburnea CBS 473.64 TaxID=1395130 RepID=A0A6A6RXE8_9PLEO|nr:hypothetical protein P280DRAFT_470885 [Massarina eburnea CBS 473.64]
MSKTKAKRQRREVKRESAKKKVAAQRKAAKPSPAPSHGPPSKKQKPNAPTTTTSSATPKPATKPPTQASQQHAVPFGVYDNILLVGEGDFSFTRSLALEHGCANVTATSFDSEEEVRSKYPSFADVEKELKELVPPVPILHDVDATKLNTYKTLRPEGAGGAGGEETGWDIIAFMFPHTGGMSTDVNRQARANQALLVKFFESCVYEIAAKPPRCAPSPFLKIGGRVFVALFEGAAYELWCIRNLARHAGLKVVESYRFDWTQYPGYHHMRTLGTVEGAGAWKGEEREARMYVFEKVGKGGDKSGDAEGKKGKGKGKKRPRDESGSDSEGA